MFIFAAGVMMKTGCCAVGGGRVGSTCIGYVCVLAAAAAVRLPSDGRDAFCFVRLSYCWQEFVDQAFVDHVCLSKFHVACFHVASMLMLLL